MSDFNEEYLLIETSEFLVEVGEDDELYNEGTYGAALSIYLENELNKRGYSGGAILEDWGYLISVAKDDEIHNVILDVAIYCPNKKNEIPMEYVVLVLSRKLKIWVWSKFKSVSIEPQLLELQIAVKGILNAAPNTAILSITDDMPA